MGRVRGRPFGQRHLRATPSPDTVPLSQTLPSLDSAARQLRSRWPVVRVASLAAVPAPSAGSTEPSPPAGATPSTVPPMRRATFAFTGDTLMHSPLVRQARRNAGGTGYDFSPMFARVAPLLGLSDLAVCHLESPVAPPGEALSTAPSTACRPRSGSRWRRAGYDRCSTAEQPLGGSWYRWHRCHRRHRARSRGHHPGGHGSHRGGGGHALTVVNGITVGHISYTFGLNGFRRPTDEPWRVELIDDGHIIATPMTPGPEAPRS